MAGWRIWLIKRVLSLQVSLSSLNRHAVATRADVGLPKATVLMRHFHEILPEAEVKLQYSPHH